MNSYARLRESQQYLNEPGKLRELFSEDGYIFMKNVLDKKAVQRVKREVIGVSKRYGFVEKKVTLEPIWSKRPLNETELSLDSPFVKSLCTLKALMKLARTKELIVVVRNVLGCNAYPWKNNQDQVKVIPPGDFMRNLGHVSLPAATPAHQDFYSFRSLDFCTVWLPLMEIDEKVGGLALRQGSHNNGLCEHWWRGAVQLGVAETIDEVVAWSNTGGVVLGGTVKSVGEVHTWVRSDYRIGDILIFHPLMLHRGLPNTSDRVRLSVDFRYQKKGTPAPWVVSHRAEYAMKFLRESQQYINQLTLDTDIAGKAWQRIREEGPRRQNIPERIAKILQELNGEIRQ